MKNLHQKDFRGSKRLYGILDLFDWLSGIYIKLIHFYLRGDIDLKLLRFFEISRLSSIGSFSLVAILDWESYVETLESNSKEDGWILSLRKKVVVRIESVFLSVILASILLLHTIERMVNLMMIHIKLYLTNVPTND